MFWTISGWAIALLSLLVNILQLLKNTELKKQVSSAKQNVGDGSTSVQQTHSGNGNITNIGGDGVINQ